MLANAVSALRILLSPFVALAVTGGWSVAPWLFLVAAATDFVDGAIARALRQETTFGKVLDATADRVLTLVVVISIFMRTGFPPAWSLAVMLVRDLFLVAGALALSGINERIAVPFVSKLATFALFVSYFILIYGLAIGRALFWIGFGLYLVAGLTYLVKGKKVWQASRHLPASS